MSMPIYLLDLKDSSKGARRTPAAMPGPVHRVREGIMAEMQRSSDFQYGVSN
jgi:hypothetical protein